MAERLTPQDSQLEREMSARALTMHVWLALREIQALRAMGEDVTALENTLCSTLGEVRTLHRRIAEADCRLGGDCL